MARPFGIYLHFPWCTHHCPYCDFAVTTAPQPAPGRYARALLWELALRAPAFEGLEARSVYVGGGTPSLWDPGEVAEVLAAVRARTRLPADAEVTFEVNPESCDPPRLRAWRAAGVNRISVGAQSFDPGVLAKLGRRHGPEAAERAIRDAAAVVGNVSVDLIYGARRSTAETARRDAERAVAAGAVHVSAYALTLDAEVMAEEVPLARLRRQGRLPLPTEEETLAQARALRAALRRGGLRRYEISNFGRPGRESVHNGLYWAGEGYLGLGAGAYGFVPAPSAAGEPAGGVRYGNARGVDDYLAAVEGGRPPTAEEDPVSPAAARNERVMLALRTVRGAPPEALPEGAAREVEQLVRARLAVRRGGRLVLTSKGMDLHTSVAGRLMG